MDKVFKDYPSRWGMLMTVFCLNLANNALWISYSSVATISAEYYKKDVGAIDLLSSIGFFVGIPTCLASTWIVDKLGLKTAVYLGCILTFMGGLVRGISSFPMIGDSIDKETQYWLSFVGQALTGAGNPMAVSVPTKVSQHWFKESQRTFATVTLAMSLPLGIVLGQGITPLFVKSLDDVPTMNWVWFIPAATTMILCMVTVKHSAPPTPPSKSAEFDQHSLPYLLSMKALVTNKEYVMINIAVGGAVGFFNCFATQLEQMMCSRGYSDLYSGLCGSLLLGTGFIGSIFTGVFVQKTGKMEEVAKVFYGIACLAGIAATQLMRKPDQQVAIALCCSLFGVFGFGMYPIGLELSVENTYPIDESAGTALIFLSGQIQGGILIAISAALEQDLTPQAMEIQECSKGGEGVVDLPVGKDHTRFLLFISGYITLLALTFIFGLNTKYKRTLANRAKEEQQETGPKKNAVDLEI